MSVARDEGTHVTEILPASGSVTRLNPTSARLYVPTGPDKGKSALVGSTPISVGADPACQLTLVDRSVSRRHAEVWREADFVIVRDLGSTNGTFYHDARVREVSVPLGGEISFGKTRVKIVPEEVSVEAKPHVSERLGALVGGDLRMREIFTLIEDIAESEVTVVIEGETGTGKELVARAIHEHSKRKKGELVVFDCSNQPKDLIESALFGHVKGAFTGATAPRAGAFERAHGGTIFLDELGELGLDLQPKLLRVLENREIQKVGGDGYDPVDTRVIAATNRNLRAEVRAGRFREDLYYRLAVVKIQLPPLRERLADIPRLVTHFMELNHAQVPIDPSSWDRLRGHTWPGNVRELKNVVDRAVALSRNKPSVDLAAFIQHDEPMEHAGPLTPAVPISTDFGVSFKEAKGKVISDFESRYIEGLLRQHDNNISVASREAGIDRKHFKELMRKYGITARDPEEED
ncbi:MAG: sigma 54-dependent Fis family transcriptional regulator [Deltaproteobacteria bacterium]|nr:sigma 54-dependent Fis family transcriptional regulator [Deltaproteobacteria bacterium]